MTMECSNATQMQMMLQNQSYSSDLVNNSIEMKTFDVQSLESSDTYMSCNTHPFDSIADLTEDANHQLSQSQHHQNVYVNPLETMDHQRSESSNNDISKPQLTKAISEDNRTINLIMQSDHCNNSNETISTSSTASPLIKKHKFIHGLRTRFDETTVNTNDHHESGKSVKPKVAIKTSFFPYRGRTGSGSKTSLLISDLSRESTKKKSILKKGDSSVCTQSKEEMERLLPDTPQHSAQRPTAPQFLSLTSASSAAVSRPTGFLTPQGSIPSNVTFFGSDSATKTKPSLKQISSSKSWKVQSFNHPQQNPPILLPPPLLPPPLLPLPPPSTTRLIGAVAPIQLNTKMVVKKNDSPLVRCSNPSCYYNRVGHATPLCAGCGHRMETLNSETHSKPHSVPLSPSTPDAKIQDCMSRQSSNESAPPACS